MIDFPASPTLGQQFTAAGVTWTWDGTKWTAAGLSVAYLPLAGGTMSGPIVLAADPAAAMQPVTLQYFNARPMIGDNRVINGDMRIDQRNGGAAGTAIGGYTLDRWYYGTGQAGKGTWQRQVSGLPAFPYCLSFTSSSAYTPLATDTFAFWHSFEADMVSDFAWGTASAQPVTLSFYVYSSKTGAFSGAFSNYTSTRCYPFSYSIPTANTWTKIVVTIPGDTGGAWVMSGNAGSIYVDFDLGAGATLRGPAGAWATTSGTVYYVGVTGAQSIVNTNGATWYLTGVKLEIGSVATPYNRQSLAKSMADCQRYYQIINSAVIAGYNAAGSPIWGSATLQVTMRATPTTGYFSPTYNNSSGVANFGITLNTVTSYALVTGTGGANVTYSVTLNAEI